MNDLLWWVLAGVIVCAIAAIVGYRAYAARAALKRQAERHAAEDAARLQAQRRAAAQDAARVEAARAKAQAQRLVDARRAAEVAKAEAVRTAAAQAALKAAAERHAAEEAARARVAAAAAAAREAARLAAERAAVVAPPPPAPAPVAPAPLPPIVLTPPPRRKTREQTLVMVADDSKIVRVKTGRLLEQHRYRVSYATDGLDAAKQLQSNMPDVVITDVEMPGMDGFELTRQVRGNPGTAHIPVIMITAAEDRHRDDAQRAGVSMLLGKPYPEDELIAHIRRAMNDDAGA